MPNHSWAALVVAVLVASGAGWVVADDKPLKPGEVREFEIATGVKMKFCWIPPGEAQLGSPKKEQDYVTQHILEGKGWARKDTESASKRGRYTSKGYWLGKYPVTQGEWRAVIGANPSYYSKDGGGKVKVEGLDTSRFPVEWVTCDECGKFLDKMNDRRGTEKLFGKRGKFVLPHEDEWEYACRGGLGNGRAFYFGDSLNGKQANCNGNQPYGTDIKGPDKRRTTEVGAYEVEAPHPWGLCDMHGNVWQWCGNWYDAKHTERVTRGGSFHYGGWVCRAATSSRCGPGGLMDDLGFRVCFRLD